MSMRTKSLVTFALLAACGDGATLDHETDAGELDLVDAASPSLAIDAAVTATPGVDPISVESWPFEASSESRRSNVLDAYGCGDSLPAGGEEVVYQLDIPVDGFLAVTLSEPAGSRDLRPRILSALDARACLDEGASHAGAGVTPGRYYVVLDGPPAPATAGTGFELRIQFTEVLSFEAMGMSPAHARDSLHAFGVAWARNDTERFEYATIDFSLHARERREWIIDLGTGELLWNIHVPHGRGSIAAGDEDGVATIFSNVPESHMSSLGMMRTAEPYVGDYGPSYRIDGLEPNFNDNVRRRDIVMHPWEYSRPTYVDENGTARPTWGCPAIDDTIAPAVRDRLDNGALMFFWFPTGDWHEQSTYLH